MINKLLPLIMFIVAACGTNSTSSQSPASPTPLLVQLQQRSDQIQTWAPHCDKYPGLVYPSFDPNGQPYDCGDGDGVYLNGQLCFVGVAGACDAVKDSVGADGRLWRSPYRRANGDAGTDTASRDQFIGLMAYLVTTKDTATATRFYSYLESHDYLLCPTATDDECLLGPGNYGLMGLVWHYLGLNRTPLMVINEGAVQIELLAAAPLTPAGYQLYLIDYQLLILMRTGDYNASGVKAVQAVYAAQPNNPLFRYLAVGSDATTIQLAVDQAPISKPAPAWNWSFADDDRSLPWTNSVGWDYVFLYKLMTQGVQ